MERTGERGRRVLAAYRSESPATRAHVAGRWRTAPVTEVESFVPRFGDVLDLGCGNGVVSIDMALASPHRRIHAVDVNSERTAVAGRAVAAARVADRVTVGQVPPAWRPAAQSYDAVVVVDVLYLLGRSTAFELVDALVAALRPGGTLVLKEMADRPRWKAAANRFQEAVAVRGIGLTTGDHVDVIPVEELARHLRAAEIPVRTVALDRGHVHPHAAVVAGPT